MDYQPIRLHDIYKNKTNSLMVEIIGTKGGKFKARTLTQKSGVYAGSHTLALRTIQKSYELVDKKTLL